MCIPVSGILREPNFGCLLVRTHSGGKCLLNQDTSLPVLVYFPVKLSGHGTVLLRLLPQYKDLAQATVSHY